MIYPELWYIQTGSWYVPAAGPSPQVCVCVCVGGGGGVAGDEANFCSIFLFGCIASGLICVSTQLEFLYSFKF